MREQNSRILIALKTIRPIGTQKSNPAYGDINTNDPKWTCSFSNAVYHIGLPLKVCCQLDLLIVDGHEPIYPVGKLLTLIALAVRFYARKSMFNRPYWGKRLKCPAG